MEKADESDNSGDSDTTDDEQKIEEGDVTEETPDDNNAPVIEEPADDTSNEEQDVTDEGAAGSDEELTNENKPVDETTVPEGENSSSKVSSNQILSLETKAETKIVIKGVAKNAENQDELADLTSAKIHFTDGCASEDGAEVRENVDITFRVLMEAGYKVDSVMYAAAENEEDLTLAAANKSLTASDGIYTIAKSEFTSNNKNTKNILIVVKAAETQFTVKSGSVASGVTVNTVATADSGDTSLAAIGSGKAFDYSEANAITLAMSGMAAGKAYIVTARADGEAKELTAGSEAEVTAGTKYIPYTLNVSELEGVEQYVDQDITITVTEVADVTVTASPITKTAGYDATIAPATIPAEGADGYVAYTESGSYNAGDKVVFTITPAANSNWADITTDDITAKLTKNEEETPLTVGTNVPEAITVAEGTTAYVVEIPADVEDGYTLEIDVKAELGEKAKVITFTKNGHADADKVVTIMGGDASADAEIKTDSIKTVADSYAVDIASREGYQMEKVEVTVKGAYTDAANGAFADYKYVLDENADPEKDGSNYPRYTVAGTIDLKGTNTPGTSDGRAWTATEITIAVTVSEEIEGADEEKQISFGSTSEAYNGNPYAYEVETFERKDDDGNITEKVTYDEDAETATIAEGTQYLTFSVAAETEPQVELKLKGENGDADESGLLELVGETAGKYEYRVAAKALIGGEGHISITRLAKSLTANFDDNARVSYTNAEDENEETYRLTNGSAESVDTDASLEITVEPVTGKAPIASVTYQVGEEGAEQTAQADSEGKYVFSVKASDDVTVEVERVADERLFVANGDDAEEIAPDSVVEVDYENEISAYLLDADDSYISIINATVKDGTALAETKASITDNVATLKVAKNEYEKELTVTLLKADRTTVSFKVSSDKAVEEVISYTNAKGEAVTAASLNADTSLVLRVNVKDGNVNKLRAAVVATPAASATVPEKVPADATNGNDNITATLSNGTLTIIAAALKDKVDAAGTILLYEVGDAEKTVLSSLNVSVNAPIMKGQTAAATAGLTDGRTVSVNITVPDEVKNESLRAGILGYEIKVTAPALATAAPEGFTAEEWTATRNSMTANIGTGSDYAAGKFVSRGQINGGHTIRVLDDNVKPARIDGIKILVTPVQYTNRSDRTDANKISGTAAAEIETSTTAPIYSDTLKLGKGANTLTTGQDADIVVAVPVFAKDAQYKRVNVEIIDSTTGMAHAEASDFEANWDAVNGSVTVNAVGADYYSNTNGEYKNLAVKVTAFTEDGDYGVSGVKKLSVINGVEDLDLYVQPEILTTGKKVTVKSTITYNDETTNKKYAPKKKAVTYRIVGVDSTYENDYLYEAPLSAKLSAAVDAKGTKVVSVDKSGKVTVAAGYTPSSKWVENSFQVLAEAADYEGNPVKALSGPITIIASDTVLNDLSVFEAGTSGWRNAKKVTGDLPVKTTSSQYRLAMLKPGTPEKAAYNLSTDTVDYELLDVKSSNKGVVVDAYGYITVTKLGKTNFTMAAKSNSKNKKELKNVNFVMENTDLYAEVTRYQDSTFKKAIETKYFNAAGTIDVTGNTTGYFSVNIMKKTGESYEKFALPNYALSFKNAKKVTPVSSDRYEYTDDAYIVATGSTGKKATVITVNNKGVKPAKKFEITISNTTADTLAGNAPKLALADKKQRILADGGYNTVPVTVTAAKKGEILPADTYVMLSADQTKKTKANVNNVFDGSLDTPILLNKTGDSTAMFNVDLCTSQAESYTLIATLGTMADGIFTQTYKEARITLKAVKANINIKATAKYTLNPYGVSSEKLIVSGGDYSVYYDGYGIDADYEQYNYAKNVIQKDGTPNKFNEYFMATADEYGHVDQIMINPALTAEQLANLEDQDFLKANTTGYITVSNGEKAVDVKLTITVKQQKDMKLKAVATPVIEGNDVITDIQIMNGKNPVALAQYTAEGGSFKAYYTDDVAKVQGEPAAEAERLANGIIRVKAAEAKKGSDTIVLRVLPADTAASYRTVHAQNNPDPLKTYGTDVPSVKITIAANTTANKVVVANNDKKWIVARNDWNATNEFSGWSTARPYTFKNRLSVAQGQEITVASDTSYVSFNSDSYSVDGRQWLTIDLDKAKLTEAMAAPRSKVAWGKKVNVKATFSYLGTPVDGGDAPELLKSDSVTFAITLPEKEGFESADALNAAVEANKATLQNLADKRTAEYWQISDYTRQDVADAVANDLKEAVLDMSKGTTAVITANGTYNASTNVYTYNLSVAGKAYRFTVLGTTPTAYSVAQWIDNNYSDCMDEDAEALGLSFYPVTTSDALAAKLRGILTKENLLTRNISISVESVVCKAPTTNDGGELQAVVRVKDSNEEPHSSSYTRNVVISYEFAQLEAATAYQKGGANGLDTKLGSNNDDGVNNMVQIFSDAYIASNGDISEDNEIGEEMKKALIAGIEEFAKTLIAENPYLSVKGIDADSFECNYESSAWKLAFEITYTDSTPDAEEAEFTTVIEASDNIAVTANAVPSFQTVGQLKSAADEAFEAAYMLIKNVSTADAAVAEIRSIIEKASLNPTYDASESLEIEVESFTAPTAEVNGVINVEVTYDADAESPSTTGSYTFVIVRSDDLLGNETDEDGNETETPNLGDRDRVKDLIKASLTPAAINEAVQNYWKDNAKDNVAATDLVESVKRLVTACLGKSGVTTISLADTDPVTIAAEGFKLPASSTDTTGKLGEITIKLKDSNNDPAWEETDAAVTIPVTDLSASELFQSEAEFRDAVKYGLTNSGIAYTASWFGEDGNIKEESKTAIITAITDEMKKEKYAANPLWKASAYQTNVKAEAIADKESGNTEYKATVINNVKVTIGTGEGAEATINVKLCTEDEMSLIKSVKITRIGSVTVADGNSAESPAEITNSESDLSLDLNAAVTATSGATDEDKVVSWEVKDKDGNALTGGVSGIKGKDGKLIIPANAYAEEGNVVVKITAEAAGSPISGVDNTDANKATAYAKIFLTEKVTGIQLLNEDGDAEALTSFEAPATGGSDVEYTFSTKLVGSHIKTDTKAEFEEITGITDSNVTFEKQSDTSKMKLTVKAGAADHSGANAITLKAAVGTAATLTQPITITANETAADKIALGFNTEGMADAEWTAGTAETDGVLVVKNAAVKDVKIPVTITDSSNAERNWDTVEIAVKTGAQEFTEINSDNAEIEVEEGTGKEKGKIFLVVKNIMPAILAKQAADSENNVEAVQPLILTLTATSAADAAKGQAAVAAALDFEIVVEKKITSITIAHDSEASSETYVDDNFKVTKQDSETTVTLKATVVGAHVNDEGDDQNVTWKITSKGARSKATINADGKVTIPKESVDNIIKVTATSKVDKTISKTISLKVV